MFKTVRNMIASLGVMATLLFVPLAVPGVAAAADIQNNLCGGSNLNLADNQDCSQTSQGTTSLNTLIKNVVNVFSVVVGIIAVIMIVYGGFQYVTSGGDSGKLGNARSAIIYALVGLVVVAVAQFIVQFVLNRLTNFN